MTEQVHRWPLELAAAGVGMLVSAALLGLAISTSISLGLSANPLQAAGTSLVTITPGRAPAIGETTGAGHPGTLTVADVDAITRAIPAVSVTSRVVSGSAPTVTVDSDPQALILGVDPSYIQLWTGALARGDFFSAQDATAANRVAVLGQTAAATLFPTGQSPIGQTIRVRNQPFTIVGVLASHVASGLQSPDASVLVPFQTAQVRLFGTGSVYELVLQVADASQADVVTAQVQQLLRQRHRVGPGQADDFTVLSGPSIAAPKSDNAALPTLLRTVREIQQYGCVAKGFCRP